MKYIDLHVHSNASDGTLSPTKVVELAVFHNLAAIALTDHDTLDGLKEAQQAAINLERQGHLIQVIPGTEISAGYNGSDIHILGLLIDTESESLKRALNEARKGRDERNEKMAQNLREAGVDITVAKLREIEGEAVLTRAHFAKYMVELGVVKSMKDAFTRYLNSDTPYYVPREYLSPKDAIRLIHESGGIAVLAHPLLYKLTLEGIDELLSYLTDFGLDGIEAIYSSNTGFDEGRMLHYANKYGLVITGGSDFHGSNKPNLDIGTGYGNLQIPYSILTKLEERVKQYRKNKV